MDRRRNLVSLTPQGRAQLRRLRRVVDGVQDRLLGDLSAADRRRLTALLARIAAEPA